MTIRLSSAVPFRIEHDGDDFVVLDDWGYSLAYADTREEAEQAQRAFENVLAPRFSRDEAIQIAYDAMNAEDARPPATKLEAYRLGARRVLLALAAAGVFWDGCDMADRLDAVGIR